MKRLAAGAVVLALVLVGCSAPSPAPTDGQAPLPSGTFPITVEHSLGTTTIEREPTRVVTLGPADADVVLALGVVPVGIHSLYGFDKGVGPWAEAALGAATPAVTKGRTIPYEAIAALRPDLILNIGSGGEQEEYQTLSRIAPTVALPKGAAPYSPRWQAATQLIAQALGRPEQGERVVADTEGYLRRIAAENPGFAGKTMTYLDMYNSQAYVGSRDDTVVTTMLELGFRNTPFVDGRPAEQAENPLSAELLPQVDADVLLVYGFGAGRDEVLRGNAGLANLSSVREGRAYFLPDLALSAPSVFSIPFGVDRMLPFLRTAAG